VAEDSSGLVIDGGNFINRKRRLFASGAMALKKYPRWLSIPCPSRF